jgi:hypothetical protein
MQPVRSGSDGSRRRDSRCGEQPPRLEQRARRGRAPITARVRVTSGQGAPQLRSASRSRGNARRWAGGGRLLRPAPSLRSFAKTLASANTEDHSTLPVLPRAVGRVNLPCWCSGRGRGCRRPSRFVASRWRWRMPLARMWTGRAPVNLSAWIVDPAEVASAIALGSVPSAAEAPRWREGGSSPSAG